MRVRETRVGRETGSERCTVVGRLHDGNLLSRFMSVASGAGVFGRKLESGEVMRAGHPVGIDSFIRMGRKSQDGTFTLSYHETCPAVAPAGEVLWGK